MSAPIICITPNPALDVTYRVPQLKPHSTNRVDEKGVRPGGKGINVARILDAAGLEASVLGPSGGETGRKVADLLRASHPALSQEWVECAWETRTTVAVVDDEDTTMFNEAGGPVSRDDWEELIRRTQLALNPGTVVTVSGSLPPGVSPEDLGRLIATINACDAITVVDTSGPALLAAADAGAHVLKPNHHELQDATGSSSLEKGTNDLLTRGCRAVVVSRGERGLLLNAGDRRVSARLPEALTGNPTGAGDAVVAALARGIATSIRPGGTTAEARQGQAVVLGGARTDQGESMAAALHEALPTAVAWSAAAVLSPFAGEIEHSEIERLRAIVEIEEE